MRKPIFVSNKRYNSNIDAIKKVAGKYVIATNDGRFISIDEKARLLLAELENAVDSDLSYADDVTLAFFDKVVLKYELYLPEGLSANKSAVQPTLTVHFPLLSKRFVNAVGSALGWLFKPTVLILLAGLGLGTHGWYLFEHADLFNYQFVFSYQPSDIMIVMLLGVLNSFVHEFGHASACKRFAGNTGEIGIGLNAVLVVFYANVSYLHMLSRWHRVSVGLAGVYFQLIFGSAIILLSQSYSSLDKFMVLYFIGLLFNLVPFFRNDGYWVLNDALEKQHLMREVFAFVFKKQRFEWVYLIYGLLLAAFTAGIVLLLARFAIFRGPEMLLEFIRTESHLFADYVQITLVICHYGVIVFAICSLLQLALSKYFNKSTQTNEKPLFNS